MSFVPLDFIPMKRFSTISILPTPCFPLWNQRVGYWSMNTYKCTYSPLTHTLTVPNDICMFMWLIMNGYNLRFLIAPLRSHREAQALIRSLLKTWQYTLRLNSFMLTRSHSDSRRSPAASLYTFLPNMQDFDWNTLREPTYISVRNIIHIRERRVARENNKRSAARKWERNDQNNNDNDKTGQTDGWMDGYIMLYLFI